MKRRFFSTVLFLAASLMGGCAPFSKEIMRQVDPTLTFAEVQKDPQPYVGKIVLWGGVIVGVENRKDETLLKVMRTGLDYEKRPVNLDRSTGRFIARYAGFLDPAIYKEGREITVVGEVVGKEFLSLGDTMYAYPVILAKEARLWERRVEIPYDYPPWFWAPYPPYWWYRYPYWGYPFYYW
jgi:outer membrane lipoprotein